MLEIESSRYFNKSNNHSFWIYYIADQAPSTSLLLILEQYTEQSRQGPPSSHLSSPLLPTLKSIRSGQMSPQFSLAIFFANSLSSVAKFCTIFTLIKNLYSICVAQNILIFLSVSVYTVVSATQRNRLNINIRLEIALHRELPEKYVHLCLERTSIFCLWRFYLFISWYIIN